MADINWSPSSDLSSFYMGRMAPPIKLPDGTYIPTPNVLSVDQIYQGILPPSVPSTPLVSRSVNTVPVDSNGNPIVGSRGEQRLGARPAFTVGTQPALTATMPPGARPSNIPLPSMPPPSTLSAAWDPFNTINENADQSRLPLNQGTDGIEAMQAFVSGQGANPAVSAIDQATGVPMPRARPDLVMPMMPSPLLRAPAIPGPRNSSTPTGGNYTVKRGDTVWDLARKNNTTVNAIAIANGLRDPSKIRAGQQLTIPSVPAPRMRPPAMNKKPSGPPAGMTVDEVGALRYHG